MEQVTKLVWKQLEKGNKPSMTFPWWEMSVQQELFGQNVEE